MISIMMTRTYSIQITATQPQEQKELKIEEPCWAHLTGPGMTNDVFDTESHAIGRGPDAFSAITNLLDKLCKEYDLLCAMKQDDLSANAQKRKAVLQNFMDNQP